MSIPALHLEFPHNWSVQVLPQRPLILPPRRFVYPAQAEEVERGALELLIRPGAQSKQDSLFAHDFLATCALGFADPQALSGIWSMPNPDELCAVSGGYAYLIDAVNPEQFTFLELRPVFAIYPAVNADLLLFIGNRNILAWGKGGLAWDSGKLSDEGIRVDRVDANRFFGQGWDMFTDRETPFTLDLASGRPIKTT